MRAGAGLMPIANTNRYVRRADGAVEIHTRLGDVFLIDAADEGTARLHCWSRHEHGYARAVARDAGRQRTVYLHRLICATDEQRPHVDHINGDPADCRHQNLRPCSRQENQRNQRLRADSRTGLKGVGLHGPTGKYRARASAGSVVIDSGLYETPAEAFAAAVRRRDQLHGEFARHG